MKGYLIYTVRVENRFPYEHTRIVSRPVPETIVIHIWLLYKNPLLSRIMNYIVFDFSVE
jgi:hypothetical protein